MLEVRRSPHAGGDHVRGQVRQDGPLEPARDRGAVALRRPRPVDAALGVGHRREHVEGVAAGRRERRVGGGGTMEIEAEIARQDLSPEDVVEQLAIRLAEQDEMVRHVRVAPAGPEVPDEEAHRVAGAFDAPIGPVTPVGHGHQVPVGRRRVRVGDDHVRPHDLPRRQADAGGAAPLDQDFVDRGV